MVAIPLVILLAIQLFHQGWSLGMDRLAWLAQDASIEVSHLEGLSASAWAYHSTASSPASSAWVTVVILQHCLHVTVDLT